MVTLLILFMMVFFRSNKLVPASLSTKPTTLMVLSASLMLMELRESGYDEPVNAWYADGSSELSMPDLREPM